MNYVSAVLCLVPSRLVCQVDQELGVPWILATDLPLDTSCTFLLGISGFRTPLFEIFALRPPVLVWDFWLQDPPCSGFFKVGPLLFEIFGRVSSAVSGRMRRVSEFSRQHLLYSIFLQVAHLGFGTRFTNSSKKPVMGN